MAVQNQRLPKDNLKSAMPVPPPPSAVMAPSPFAAETQPTSAASANLSMPTTKANYQAQAPPTAAGSSATAAMTTNPNSSAPAHQQPSSSSTSPNAVTSAQTNANGGPRVSFNRDVHVKRIGKRSNDLTNFETTNLLPPQQYVAPAYHQLPADLSAENIQKEAALVLAQAKRHKSIAENGDNIPTFRVKTKRSGDSAATNPKKFHSLPSRKKKPPAAKPVTRSSSDAAGKKPTKRPSIFSLFSRKSDTNINQAERDPRFEDSGGRRLVRSKSDVGSSSYRLKKVLKEPKSALSAGSNKHLPTQLSPIIENDSKDDYFEEDFAKHTRVRRKSEAITDKEKHESAINKLLGRSRSQPEVDGVGLVGRIPVSDVIKEKILSLQAKSQENMHSSQLPVQKLPLTKGHTVNGMVKRLSMERFSPPPTISGPAFSYIRPNEGITYAQLELQDEPASRTTLPRREYTRSPVREYRSPVREMRSPSRDIFTPDRELVTTTVINRSISKPEDQTDFIGTSQRNNYSPSYNTNNGTTTIHIGGSFSPSPWQMLSPRNLSDEDEGLGLETRKYYDEEQLKRSKSPAEPPIVPKIRSITPPRENGYHAGERYHAPNRDVNPNDDMGYRRARLESRILTRRFGDSGTLERNGYSRENSHERLLEERENYPPKRYLSPERELHRESYEPMRYHKPEVKEILNKYSPERSHLDIISPSTVVAPPPNGTMEKTSRYKHTKYYDDGHGGVKEVYERETQFDTEGKPHVRETRHRERLDSYTGKVIRENSPIMEPRHRERLDSYSKNARDSSPSLLEARHRERLDSFTHTKTTRDSSPLMERQLITDYEPKSFDSQFTTTDQYRSSPENMKRYDMNSDRGVNTGRLSSEDRWHSSLKRDKLQQRSFDKGDSGIENDFRKESFNGDLVTRWRKPTTDDNIKSCESFLKKERRYCEHERQPRRSENYAYRERSIDDGSHFDPNLDKYHGKNSSSATLKRRDQQSQTVHHDQEKTSTSTLKRSKKLGGFEKVKQLFTGGNTSGDKKDPERKSMSSSTSSSAGTQQTIKPKDKDKYMVKEEEIRSRYRVNGVVTNGSSSSGGERGGGGVGVATQTPESVREPKAIDISMRRRLSTPKASPLLLKRTSSDKNRKESPLAKPEKTSWFKSLDRRAKSKSKEKLNSTTETSSLKRSKNSHHSTSTPQAPAATKNLRFFGDTDLDSNPPTISKGSTTLHKSRPPISSNLNRSQKYSQSAYHIDRIRSDSPQRDDYRHSLASGSKSLGLTSTTTSSSATTATGSSARHKSNSMHNLDNQGNDEVDFRRRRHYSRSRELDHISESGSETEDQETKLRPGLMAARTLSRDRLDRTTRYDEHSYRRSNERPISSTPNGGDTSSGTQPPPQAPSHQHQPRRTQPYLMGPPKPARSAERRAMSYSRERDRFPAESSGTEGESSLHSQRSVVYLHATTVGAIPQPYQLRRRSISRDDLRSNKSKATNQPLQPMTRTVSRSVSMLAPWKPKLISEGYEINYSQEQNKTMATLPRKPPAHGGSSTMTRSSRKSEPLSTRNGTRRHLDYTKDDQSSLRNSSTTSASKSGLSTNLHRKK